MRHHNLEKVTLSNTGMSLVWCFWLALAPWLCGNFFGIFVLRVIETRLCRRIVPFNAVKLIGVSRRGVYLTSAHRTPRFHTSIGMFPFHLCWLNWKGGIVYPGKFDVCLSMHRSNVGRRKPTRCCIIFYWTCGMLNMFRARLCPSSGARDYATNVARGV